MRANTDAVIGYKKLKTNTVIKYENFNLFCLSSV